jgi:CBS domain-containing protein
MRVNRLMTRDVRTCRAEETLADAARLMWDSDVGALPVVDAEGRVVAVVTDRDIAMACLFSGQPLQSQKVSEAMSKRLATVFEEDEMGTLEDVMRTSQVRRVPVVNATGHLRGIITLNDLAHHRHGRLVGEGVSPEEVAGTLAVISSARTAQPPPHQLAA